MPESRASPAPAGPSAASPATNERPKMHRMQSVAKKLVINHPLRAPPTFINDLDTENSPHVQHFIPYESIAFEEPDGPGLRRHYHKQTKWTRVIEEVLQYVLASAMTLQIAGLVMLLFFGTEKLASKRIHHYAELVEEGHTADAVVFALWTCLLAALIPAVVVLLWAPGVIGSGMVQLIAFLNGANSITKSTITNLWARYFGIYGISISGLYSGIDGPMAMIGASIAVNIVQRVRKIPLVRRYFYGEARPIDNADHAVKAGRNALFSFLEQKALRLFATLGAAVAISAIFRSPLGGVMFTLEETTSFFEPRILTRALFCTMIAALLVGFHMARILHLPTVDESFSSLGGLQLTLFPTEVHCNRTTQMTTGEAVFLLAGYALFGVCLSLLGTVWNRALSKVQDLRQPYTVFHLEPKPVETKPRKVKTEVRRHRGKKHVVQECGTLTAPRKPVRVQSAQPSHTRRTVVGIMRLTEVAIVCIITTLIVVLLPTSHDVDPCIPLTKATEHVLDYTPAACFEGVVTNATVVSDSTLRSCLEGLAGVCLPSELKTAYQENIIRNFYSDSQVQAAGNRTVIGKPTEQASTEPVPVEQEAGAIPVMNLTKFGPSSSPSEPVDLRSLGLRMRSAANRRSALSKRQEEVLPPAQKGLEDNDLLVPITDLHAQHGKLDAEGECYYQLRSLLYAMPEQQLKVLLSRGLYRLLDVKSLGIFWGVYMFLSLITYYIALPTDLVIPNLIMGATTGRLLGMAWNYLTTGLDQDPGFFALLGMAGMWSATSRLTLTVIVIAFEMTGDYDAIPALIVTCFSAAFCSSFLGDSLYHREAHRMKVPILPFEAPHVLRSITIRKIMAYRNLVVVTCTATLSACVEAIDTGHIGFPVCEKLDVEDALGRTMTKYRPVGFVMRDLLGETVRNLTREGYDMETTRVDLTSVMNVSPTIVKEDATASKVFSVIRTLGLRHVMVVDADGFLVGLVTRKDLLRGIHAYESGARRRHVGSRRTTHHRRHPDHGTADRHMDHSASTLVVAHQNIRGDRSSLVLPRNENDEKKTAVEETGDHTVHTEASDRVSLCSADNLHLLAATASQVQVDHPPAETMPTSDPIPQPQTIPEADAMQDTRRGSRSSGKRAWMRGVAQIRMRRALQQTLDALRLDEESSSSSSSSSSSDSDSSSSDDEAGRP